MILIFVLWIIVHNLLSLILPNIIPHLGFFPYIDQLPGYNLPPWIYSLANFDGIHYLLIAKNGYSQYEQAFFPLYPLLIRYLTRIFDSNYLTTAILISNASFFIGIYIFKKYLRSIVKNSQTIKYSILFLLFFPTSFFFSAVYTEGLFFLFIICALFFLNKEKLASTALFAILASFTRLMGIFLIIPFAVYVFYKVIKTKKLIFKFLLLLISPLIGLTIYSLYLWQTTSDPLFFLNSQPVFGANRSTNLIFIPQVIYRYIKILITANHDFRYYVAVGELAIFLMVFFVLIWELFRIIKNNTFETRLGLNLFSLANLLLPTLTGTLSSIPRYTLLSLSFFIVCGEIKNALIKNITLIVFALFHIIIFGLFIQGYFVS